MYFGLGNHGFQNKFTITLIWKYPLVISVFLDIHRCAFIPGVVIRTTRLLETNAVIAGQIDIAK